MRVKILQWNILYSEDPANIVSLVKKIDPDIFCAQELIQNTQNHTDTALYIAKKLRFNYYSHPGDTWSPPKKNKTSQSNAIFSRFKILYPSFHYIAPPMHNPPNAWHEGRVYIETRFEINGRLLTVGTTHFSYSRRFKINKKKRHELSELLKVFKNKNYIFAGDLNSNPKSTIIKTFKKYLKNAGPSFSQPTWPTRHYENSGFVEDKLRWRLDYVFATPDINVVESQIIKTQYSDHLPILLTIDF